MELRRIASTAPTSPLHQAEAVVAGPFVFTSAQMATDWQSGIAPEARVHSDFPYFETSIGLQTDYILRSLARTLHAAGSGLEHVVKAYVYLASCSEFLEFDRVWKDYFTRPTTRTGLGAAGLLIPDARLEIALIAIRPGMGVEKKGNNSDAPRPLTNKVEAMRAGDFIFTAGQLAHNSVNGVPPEAAGPNGEPDMAKQIAYTVQNLGLSLKAGGASFDRIVRGQAFLNDMGDYDSFILGWNEVMTQSPTRTVVGAGSLNVRGTLLEIDLTAYIGNEPAVRVRDAAGRCAAVRCGDFIFTGGVMAAPEGTAVSSDYLPHPAYPNYSSAVKMQTAVVLEKIRAYLRELGSDLDRVVKAQVLLTDLDDFAAFEQTWKEYFPVPPARSVIRTDGLPSKDAKISIEVVAV